MRASTLNDAVAAVCPVIGVVVGRWEDRQTWRIDYSPDATDEQRAAAAAVLEAFDPNAPTINDVREEAQRRIVAMTGAADIIGCLIKQHNAQMRATELTLIKAQGGTWTAEQTAEAAALQGMADSIKAIRNKSNELEEMSPIPTDYTADSYWT